MSVCSRNHPEIELCLEEKQPCFHSHHNCEDFFFLFDQNELLQFLLFNFFSVFLSIRKFSSCYSRSFHWLSIKFKTRCPVSSHSLWLFSCWSGLSSDYLRDIPWGDNLQTQESLLLLVDFVSGFKLELMYISLIISIMSSLTHLHGF